MIRKGRELAEKIYAEMQDMDFLDYETTEADINFLCKIVHSLFLNKKKLLKLCQELNDSNRSKFTSEEIKESCDEIYFSMKHNGDSFVGFMTEYFLCVGSFKL